MSAVSTRPARRWRRTAAVSVSAALASATGGGVWLRPAVCFLARGTDTPEDVALKAADAAYDADDFALA